MTNVRVVGLGACTPLGTSWADTRKALLSGETAPERETVHNQLTRLSRIKICFDEDRPRFAHLAHRALEDLSTNPLQEEEPPAGLVACTSKGGFGEAQPTIISGSENPGLWASEVADRANRRIRKIGSPNTACATGLTALIQGTRWILDRDVREVLVVASESCFHPLLLAGYQQLGVFCDKNGMRPFHPERSGFALGEAAAAVHLAEGSHAKSRGLTSLATIEGWGETADAHHMTQMDPEARAIQWALRQALDQSNQEPSDVDVLHAHLTTTETNDATELNLLKDWPGKPILQAVKPSLGHTIGAAGLLEAIATIDVLHNDEYFPMPRVRSEDVPKSVILPDRSSRKDSRTGLTWNMGFGGHNAALAIRSTG